MQTNRFICLSIMTATCLWALMTTPAAADELVKAKDGSGVIGDKDTPKLPWCDWQVHDSDRPAPKRIKPGPAFVDAMTVFPEWAR